MPSGELVGTTLKLTTGQEVTDGHSHYPTLCVDLIGTYTLKGKDGSQINFMALTMIDPASSWFEIVELPVVNRQRTINVKGRELLKNDEIFDKSSERIARLVNKTWLCRYPRCRYIDTTTVVSSNCILNTYVIHMVLSVSQPRLETHKRMLYWNVCTK